MTTTGNGAGRRWLTLGAKSECRQEAVLVVEVGGVGAHNRGGNGGDVRERCQGVPNGCSADALLMWSG